MFTRKLISLNGLTAAATLLGSMAISEAARADHNYSIIRAKADTVYQSMLDFDRELVGHYTRSRDFGEMMATSGQIKAKAVYLRGMCYHNSPCDWSRELEGLHGMVHRLESLIESAHLRAERRLDPPIGCSGIEVRRELGAIIDMIHCMEDALSAAPVAPVVTRYPDYGYGGYGYGYTGYGYPYGYERRWNGHDHGHYGGHAGHGHGRDHYHNGIHLDGNRGGNVRVDGGGVTIGRGGMQFRIKF